ncbi:hypothetical protein CC2G_012553 [Coprinopsis cinerea AmutBmut pab1-1]|nr:hypothetical protein CC2G_012553 [Coprinopsis cinerea AmutBmut pab1-1]
MTWPPTSISFANHHDSQQGKWKPQNIVHFESSMNSIQTSARRFPPTQRATKDISALRKGPGSALSADGPIILTKPTSIAGSFYNQMSVANE